MLSYSASSRARSTVAWALISQPDRWSDWAPHLRGAWGLGRPEVELGATGCQIAVEIHAPAPLEAALAVSYGPLVSALVRNLARVAERAS